MKVAAITPSYNKKEYVSDTINGIVNQTYADWEYWIIENSTDSNTRQLVNEIATDVRIKVINRDYTLEQRNAEYIPSVILNEYLDLLPGELIFYSSDDDYPLKECFSKCTEFFNANPVAQVCYFTMEGQKQTAEGFVSNGALYTRGVLPKGNNLNCVLDGGQIMFRKSVLQSLPKPYFEPSLISASHCDGLFLTKLNNYFDFYPVNETLCIKRVTTISTHVNS